MLKTPTIPFHQQMEVTVTPGLLTEVNKTLGYHRMVSTLTRNQPQLPDRIKERKLIEEETTNDNLHQKIVEETPTQMMMTMMITMEEMAGAGKADVQNATLEDHRFKEMLLPVRGQCWNSCRVLVLLSDR